MFPGSTANSGPLEIHLALSSTGLSEGETNEFFLHLTDVLCTTDSILNCESTKYPAYLVDTL